MLFCQLWSTGVLNPYFTCNLKFQSILFVFVFNVYIISLKSEDKMSEVDRLRVQNISCYCYVLKSKKDRKEKNPNKPILLVTRSHLLEE